MRLPLLAVVLASMVVSAGCGGGHDNAANRWCTLVRHKTFAFQTKDVLDRRATTEFERVAAQAPAPVRSDLRTVMRSIRALLGGNAAYYRDPRNVRAFGAAIGRTNSYLRKQCHAEIPQTDYDKQS